MGQSRNLFIDKTRYPNRSWKILKSLMNGTTFRGKSWRGFRSSGQSIRYP